MTTPTTNAQMPPFHHPDKHALFWPEEIEAIHAYAQAYSAQRCQELEAKLAAARDALEFVINTSNHFMPSYAYSDSEAGCDLAHRLAAIYDKASAAVSNQTKEKQ